jgi:hypothetical protein
MILLVLISVRNVKILRAGRIVTAVLLQPCVANFNKNVHRLTS